jgi:glycosyltransferase 2 family protein
VRLLLKLLVALAVGAVCVALVLRDIDLDATSRALASVSLPVVSGYVAILALTHVLRAWRWAYLLRPIGVRLPWRQLLAISSVGFMAIQALPVRLGEFVRPYFVVRSGRSRMSAVLGTVAVERVVDGLLISIIFFGSYLASDRAAWSPELAAAAWVSLLLFVAALIFLAGALRWPRATIEVGLWLLLLPRLAPGLAAKLRDKLRALIQGFQVLHEPRDLLPFLFQSVLYWGTNGLGMWLLAQGMMLDVSPLAAYAAMSFTGVLISLPNSPGLVGQFHLGVVVALGAFLPESVGARSSALAYATLLHGIQLVWYTVIGLASLPFVPGSHSLRKAVVESNRAAEEMNGAGSEAR